MHSLAETCIALAKEPSFEDLWIQEMFDRITVKYGLSGRMETDEFIARRMGLEAHSAQLKVRYWRTRRHLPKTRQQCICFGEALELSTGEMETLLRRYYDNSDCEFSDTPNSEVWPWTRSVLDPLYHERRKFVNEIVDTYLRHFSDSPDPGVRVKHEPLSRYIRHQYCIDSLNFIYCPSPVRQERLNKHLVSSSFASEFSRTRMLLGNIPRRTMLRNLFLFYGADVSRKRLDDALTKLGYLALDETHALPDGQRLDFLILTLLERFEQECGDSDAAQRRQWLHTHCRMIDKELQQISMQSLRFLYFKGLRNFLQ